jgi:hypothetical protein
MFHVVVGDGGAAAAAAASTIWKNLLPKYRFIYEKFVIT